VALTVAQRERAWRWFVSHRVADMSTDPPAKFSKDELRAALAAATSWIEANQASYIAGLAGTAFAGTGSTADEKRRLFLAAFFCRYDLEP
jgi:hypothetical protein